MGEGKREIGVPSSKKIKRQFGSCRRCDFGVSNENSSRQHVQTVKLGGEIHHKHQKKRRGRGGKFFCFYEEFLPGRKKFPRFSRSSSYLSPPPLVTFPLFYFPSSSSSAPSFPLPVVSRLRLRRQTDPSPLFLFLFALSSERRPHHAPLPPLAFSLLLYYAAWRRERRFCG